MILKNKLTSKKLKISYLEFRKKFAKEIQIAYESFRKTELSKSYYKLNDDNSIESNFYFDLKWKRIVGRGLESALLRARLTPTTKRNNFGNSVWYVERI